MSAGQDDFAVVRLCCSRGGRGREDRGNGLQVGVRSSPQNEVLPEHQSAEGGKTGQVQPLTRRRVGHSSQDGELFRVQSLVELLLFMQRSDADSAQLLVMAHPIGEFITPRWTSSMGYSPHRQIETIVSHWHRFPWQAVLQ